MATAARAPRLLRFALYGNTPFLEIDREVGLDFLDWLGLGRAEFGAIEASALRPLCRRRLWPERRNLAPLVTSSSAGIARIRESKTLRQLASQVVTVLEQSPDALVHFG